MKTKTVRELILELSNRSAFWLAWAVIWRAWVIMFIVGLVIGVLEVL